MPGSELVQSLLCGLELLQIAAAEPEGLTLTEIAEKANLQKSTAYNLLRTLCAKGFLEKNSDNRFRRGVALTALVSGGKNAAALERAARALQIFQQKFPQDTLVFTELEKGVAKVKLRISPDRPGELQWWANRHFPPYMSVTALALQAANPQQHDLIEQQYPFEEYGESLWGSLEAFEQELKIIIRQGFCWRQKTTQCAAAFILPDGFVLGVSHARNSASFNPARQIEEYRLAVEEFKKSVWPSSEI